MSDYSSDRKWADQFHSQVKNILADSIPGMTGFEVAPYSDDIEEGTDYLIQLSERKVRIACRIRRGAYSDRDDITLRAWRGSGAKTELDKICERHADWYFYAWTDKEDKWIMDWVVINIPLLLANKLHEKRSVITNVDGETGLIVIPLKEIREHECQITHGTHNIKKAELWRTNIADFHPALMEQRRIGEPHS
jgi:hypothetical protein